VKPRARTAWPPRGVAGCGPDACCEYFLSEADDSRLGPFPKALLSLSSLLPPLPSSLPPCHVRLRRCGLATGWSPLSRSQETCLRLPRADGSRVHQPRSAVTDRGRTGNVASQRKEALTLVWVFRCHDGVFIVASRVSRRILLSGRPLWTDAVDRHGIDERTHWIDTLEVTENGMVPQRRARWQRNGSQIEDRQHLRGFVWPESTRLRAYKGACSSQCTVKGCEQSPCIRNDRG